METKAVIATEQPPLTASLLTLRRFDHCIRSHEGRLEAYVPVWNAAAPVPESQPPPRDPQFPPGWLQSVQPPLGLDPQMEDGHLQD